MTTELTQSTALLEALMAVRRRHRALDVAAAALRAHGPLSHADAEKLALGLYSRLTGHDHPLQSRESPAQRRQRLQAEAGRARGAKVSAEADRAAEMVVAADVVEFIDISKALNRDAVELFSRVARR